MEEGLLLKEEREEKREKVRWGILIGEEMKKLGYLAGPMVAVTLSQYLLQVISVMMVGHLDELSLSSTAIAISLCGVTGFSFLLGMASALETLSGQAYGQDPQISQEAGKFTLWLVPALFGYATLQPLIRYFQMQSMILPMLISSCITICFHIAVCWVLVFKSGLKNIGAAVAMDLSMWLNVTILGLYMKFSSTCEKTRAPFSMEIFEGMKEFFRFAVPSAVMICLEWWSFELLILLSGLLPNPQLETSVLSVCLNSIVTLYAIPYGLAAAASTRISNELGAGNPQAVEAITVSTILFISRHVFGYIFSNEKEVVDYVTNMAPLVCLSVILDCIQGTLSGVARGCGWQHIGAYINLAAFYLFGIPIAVALGFWLNFRGKGLWIGVLSGATLQTIMLATITSCTNWEKQAAKARERLFEEKSAADEAFILRE
ncbi:MATE efflux family protein [Forsythia ovata]|uniref:MATE efflux family protein n=1 Tax=Forsythia ovata TaxID=205694 RepID=A0ABD1W8X0_9LAMI